jgi:DNA mismatch endonuclease, patch repair protein
LRTLFGPPERSTRREARGKSGGRAKAAHRRLRAIGRVGFWQVPDPLTKERRRRLMSSVRTRDTQPEVRLRRALWAGGLRGWRLHPKEVPGRPDVAWLGVRLAVFVDGAFWHGHPDYYHGQSGPFWDEKIARNRARDERVNAELVERGWRVVRLWDFEIDRATTDCVARVRIALEEARGTRVRRR